jgi:hypothetical protein
MAGRNTITFLAAYLDACGRNGEKPLAGEHLDHFLPWSATREGLRIWTPPPPTENPDQ